MKQFAVIGLGTFGRNVARILTEKGCQVLAIDENEKNVEEISRTVTHVVVADATEEKILRTLGIQDMDGAIVSIGEDMSASILITLTLKELGVNMVVAKAISKLHAEVLRRVGADKIVFPERDIAERLAENLVSPNIIEEIQLSPEYNIAETFAPKEFVGKTLGELNMRTKYKVSVIAIKRKVPFVTDDGKTDFEEKMNIAPKAEDTIEEGDTLALVGRSEDINKLREK